MNQVIVESDSKQRNQALVNWMGTPFARLVHTRGGHLILLMVAAGAAGDRVVQRIYTDTVLKC